MTAYNITRMKKNLGPRIGVTAVAGLMRESTVFLGQIRTKRDQGLAQQVEPSPLGSRGYFDSFFIA